MLSHWLGTYIFLAYSSLEEGESAEKQRKDLIEKLGTVQERKLLSKGYIEVLEKVRWETHDDLKNYEELTKDLDFRLFNKLD